MQVVQTLEHPGNVTSGGPEWFATTHWSAVLEAGKEDSPRATQALEEVCRAYWYPLYAYIRRKGHSPHDAQDLTQGFFARLLRGHSLAAVEQRKGRFRTFLLASLEHFLAKERARASRQKRGGGRPILSLDDEAAEHRYGREPVDGTTAEKLYARRWAMTLLEQALERLEAECQANGQGELFALAHGLLTGERSEGGYAPMAASLGLSVGAFKVTVHRLRRSYGRLLRAEISRTVSSPAEVEEEIRFLLATLST